LLDEPSAGLTVDESRSIIQHLRDLDREATALIVAHDMDLVFGVAERIVVLHHGEVIADGTADDVRSDQTVRKVYLGLS
jgi:branched-chain amino acid transport system ATP-binding protein